MGRGVLKWYFARGVRLLVRRIARPTAHLGRGQVVEHHNGSLEFSVPLLVPRQTLKHPVAIADIRDSSQNKTANAIH